MEDLGSLLLEAQQGKAVQDMGRVHSPLPGLGTKEHLDQRGKEQRGGLAGDHQRPGSHKQGVVGTAHPEVDTKGHGSHRTLEGSLTWTSYLCGWEVEK